MRTDRGQVLVGMKLPLSREVVMALPAARPESRPTRSLALPEPSLLEVLALRSPQGISVWPSSDC